MKLFDRSVDLAQFDENSPLYPICRAWMKNQPHNRGVNSGERSMVLDLPIPLDDVSYHGYTGVYKRSCKYILNNYCFKHFEKYIPKVVYVDISFIVPHNKHYLL